MSKVRVLVGTRKGAFVLTSDGKRKKWNVSGPHFGGWEIYHVKGSPADPNRLYASQSSGWFGQLIQRSSNGGKTWEPVDNKSVYDGVPGTHQWYAECRSPDAAMIRVILPGPLRILAHAGSEVNLEVEGQVTQGAVLDALEARYPVLRGTLRDQVTQQRRPFVRFFACEEDLSHEPPDSPLPDAVASGAEPFLVVGAIAGG